MIKHPDSPAESMHRRLKWALVISTVLVIFNIFVVVTTGPVT